MRRARGVDPDVDTVNQFFGYVQVIVFDEHHAAFQMRSTAEVVPASKHVLADKVLRVRFTRDQQLYGVVAIPQQAHQAVTILQ